MVRRLTALVALALGLPFAALAGSDTARLLVSVNVVRSVEVSVVGEAGAAGLRVRTSDGGGWSAPLSALSRLPGAEVSPYAADARYVVVTILADAPLPAERGARGP